jgi:curli production assembly/transport component CsgF
MKQIGIAAVCMSVVISVMTPALATEQVYHPVSPTFGGSPANGTFLLSTAQGQGEGVNSGNQGPNLSGLTNALSGIGGGGSSTPTIVINTGTSNGTNALGIPARP